MIEPALSAEEWADKAILNLGPQPPVHDIHVWLDIRESDGWLVTGNDNGEGAYNLEVPTERIAGVVALANHALPDDDPRKITRADVSLLMGAAGPVTFPSVQGQLLAHLAAKLAALLPPPE